MPKQNTFHNHGGFFFGQNNKKNTPEEHWRKVVSLEKNCEFEVMKQEDLLISKFITSINDKKLRKTLIRKKTLNLKQTMDLLIQVSYGRRHKQSTILTAFVERRK